MKTRESVNWDLLLDVNARVRELLIGWSQGKLTTRFVADYLSHSQFAGEFRHLVRERGTNYGRSLARKALKYRDLLVN
jgi:hypothetical protein